MKFEMLSLENAYLKGSFQTFPRVCGGDPTAWKIRDFDGIFSPRMRG